MREAFSLTDFFQANETETCISKRGQPEENGSAWTNFLLQNRRLTFAGELNRAVRRDR